MYTSQEKIAREWEWQGETDSALFLHSWMCPGFQNGSKPACCNKSLPISTS